MECRLITFSLWLFSRVALFLLTIGAISNSGLEINIKMKLLNSVLWTIFSFVPYTASSITSIIGLTVLSQKYNSMHNIVYGMCIIFIITEAICHYIIYANHINEKRKKITKTIQYLLFNLILYGLIFSITGGIGSKYIMKHNSEYIMYSVGILLSPFIVGLILILISAKSVFIIVPPSFDFAIICFIFWIINIIYQLIVHYFPNLLKAKKKIFQEEINKDYHKLPSNDTVIDVFKELEDESEI